MKTSDHTNRYHEYFANVKSALAHKNAQRHQSCPDETWDN